MERVTAVTSPLDKTFAVLKATPNESALDALWRGLESPYPSLQEGALRALLERRSPAGHRELIRRWEELPDAWKTVIRERAQRLEGALRSAILSTEQPVHRNACRMAVALQAYDLVPTLVAAAEDKGNPHAELAAQATLDLCVILYEELSAPRNYRNRRDPVLVRQFVFGLLEQAIERFEQHGRMAIVEAFLLLVRRDNRVLRQCLVPAYDRLHSTVIHLLSTSARPGLVRLVLGILEDAQPPLGVINIVAHRRDVTFLRPLFRKFSDAVSPAARHNLRRIETFAFLRDDAQLLHELSEEEQRGLVHLVLASGVNRLRVLELLRAVMTCGRDPARRAACAGLVEFKGGDANQLVLRALEDADPEVQALAVRQIRDRGIPGVLRRLVEMVDSPHEVVRAAVRASLTEFNFQHYLGVFESLDPEARRSTGSLVKRIDPLAMEQLIAELVSPARSRRLRGIEVAIAMHAVRDLEPYILRLAEDEDHFVRADAARALRYSGSALAHRTVSDLLLDRSLTVQDAAAQTLARWSDAPLPAPDSAPPAVLLDGPPLDPSLHEASP